MPVEIESGKTSKLSYSFHIFRMLVIVVAFHACFSHLILPSIIQFYLAKIVPASRVDDCLSPT
jgi:hypothetical protein